MKFNTLFALAYSCYARIRANQVQGKRKALLPFSTNQVQGKRKAPTLTPPLPLPLPFSLAANFVATSHDEAGSYSPSALAPIPAPSDNRLRVLMVTGVYPTEERPHAGTFIKSQVDSLITAGLTVDILHPRPGPSPLRYISAAIQVFGKTLTGRYDIVHGHYGLWCLVARLQWRTPVVASFLGDDILGTITAEGHHSAKGQIVTAISRKLCYLADAVIVKSIQMKEEARGPQHKIFVIPNGVNFEQFHPIAREKARALLEWDQRRYYVLFSNNPAIPVKNFSLARAAAERVRSKGFDVELVVASGLPHTTVASYMNASNALILTSLAEGSPNVVKEAMACNVPVIATNVGDVDAVIGRTSGCHVCPHDPEELANALETVLQHGERTTGRQDISHLNNALIAQQIIALYTHIVPSKGRDPLQRVRRDLSPSHRK
ncbi:MAG TPA: glycosyltransferase [Ktedonobacteraceae bacterium]|nr:glycosyltransferase [Ktedonobacteraceae bacterium]